MVGVDLILEHADVATEMFRRPDPRAVRLRRHGYVFQPWPDGPLAAPCRIFPAYCFGSPIRAETSGWHANPEAPAQRADGFIAARISAER